MSARSPRRRRVKLFRQDMIKQLARPRRKKWSRLSLPRFIIQMWEEMNADRTHNPDDNFSMSEVLTAWIQSIRIVDRWLDIRREVDELGRPDRYARKWADRIVREWNKDDANARKQIYCMKRPAILVHRSTRNSPEVEEPVWHFYVEVLEGNEAVNQIHQRVAEVRQGLDDTDARIEGCRNTKAVESAIREVLAENEQIQNGRR